MVFIPDPSCQDDSDPNSITVEQARKQLHNSITPITAKETVAIAAALTRVLAADVISPIQVPGHNNSAMDGYAVRYVDLPTDTEKTFTKKGTAFAGQPFRGECQQDQCVRIMTGAVMPDGCDTVIMQEHANAEGEKITFGVGNKAQQHVRYAGEDIQQGSTVLKQGKCLTPADIGVIASLGIERVTVFKRPRVAFFSTGDELSPIGKPLERGQIYDSNRYTIAAMLQRLNFEIIDLGVIADNQTQLRNTLLHAADNADAIITSGGVSVGEADYIREILEDIGTMSFWKVAMKPGRPISFGTIGKCHFFGLPGNPVSVMATFYLFVQTSLQRLANGPITKPLLLDATIQSELRKRAGRFEFQRGTFEQDESGTINVRATGEQGSGILTSMSQANCFILLDENSTGAKTGDTVKIQPFLGLI